MSAGDASPLEDGDLADAVRAAIATEHAAIWSYGLVTAFLPAAESEPLAEAARAHRDRRDAATALWSAAAIGPAPVAAAAYRTPRPVTDAASAAALLVVAEGDVATAWRGVLERTDDAALRRAGAGAVVESATAGARWRGLAGVEPLVEAFPGAPPTP